MERDSMKGSPATREAVIVEPFLHIGTDGFYNPLTDRALPRSTDLGDVLAALAEGRSQPSQVDRQLVAELRKAGWLVDAPGATADRFLLKFVSLESSTVCNQRCYFCPVSVAPRPVHAMSSAQYADIVGQLARYRDTLQAVFMISYNEPTADKRFVDQVRVIRDAGLPPAVNTNATGLTPERTDAIIAMGGLAFLSVNLSTLDRERYAAERGGDHLPLVLRNLDYVKSRPLAPRMEMAVLGLGDTEHARQFEAIQARFAGSAFKVFSAVVNDRSGYLQLPHAEMPRRQTLRGCEQTGSRPLQHLHITPHAKVILCCQDYAESVVVGDLNEQTVEQVLRGPKMALMRRWTYGIERAPDDFICRRCKFALTR